MSETTLRRTLTGAVAATMIVMVFLAGMMLRPALSPDAGEHRPPMLGSIDTGFLQDMLVHHQQAISMAQLIDRAGIDDAVRGLARQISFSQAGEQGTMTGWLQMAGKPLENAEPMGWMTRYAGVGDGHHGGPSHTMPGMASADDLAALGSLPAREAENRFLLLMQRHHYGGIAMAQDLTAHSADQLVERFAQSMISTQTKETGLIGTVLAARGAAG